MEADEALEVVEKMDCTAINEEKQKAAQRVVDRAELRTAYVARARCVHAADQKAKKKRGGKPAKPLVFPHTLEQHEAKRYASEGGSLWRSNTRGEWCGHFPPNKRISEPYVKHGSADAALRACLRTLWSQWLRMHGRETSDCPVVGIC